MAAGAGGGRAGERPSPLHSSPGRRSARRVQVPFASARDGEAGSPVLSRLQRRRGDPACPLGETPPRERCIRAGLERGGGSEEDRGAARRVPAAGFRDPRIPRTGASRKACSRASARADPRFAGEPLGRVGVRPRELPLYSCCERGGAARGGRGHCHFKSGEVRPPEVMVTSASSPPPARERERRERERERILVFIHNFFLFLPLRQLFIPRSSQRGLQRAQLHRGNRRCGDTAPPPGPPARCAPTL